MINLQSDSNANKYGYPEYVNKFSKYSSEDLTYFKNMNETNVQVHDVFISEMLFASLNADAITTYQELLYSHIANFVSTLDLNTIEQGLKLISEYEDIPANATWDAEDIEMYQQLFATIYYSEYSPAHSYGKSYQELSQEVKTSFFTNFEPFPLTQTYYSWSSDQIIPEQEIRVIGIITNEDVNNHQINVLVLQDEYYNSFNFGEPGLYRSLISSIDVNNRDLIKKLVNNHYHEDGVIYKYQNEITTTIEQINVLVEGLAGVFVYIGIVFAVFSALLLLNYISTSVSYKKKEIGILRAIGARGLDVVGIFTKEAMIISLINFSIALIAVAGTVIFINYQFRYNYGILITILTFGFRQIFLMLAISVFVGLVSSAIPVTRIARKRPIDAIRDR
jgi:ABC-type antimicrobial peptide transport system permease subunit